MKSIVKRYLLFLSIPLIVLILVEVFTRYYFLPFSDMYLKFNDFNQAKKETKILFIGHSHAEKGINPFYINQSSFNIAYSAQDLYYDYKILNKYLNQMDSLKSLVICLDHFSFGYDESNNSLYYVSDYLLSEGFLPRNRPDYSFFLNSSSFWLFRAKYPNAILNFNGKKKTVAYENSFEKVNTPKDSICLFASGWRYSRGSMNPVDLKEYCSSTVKRNEENYRYSVENENIAYLKKMLDLVAKRNVNYPQKPVRVYILFMPVTQEYLNQISNIYFIRTEKIIRELTKEYLFTSFNDFSEMYKTQDTLFLNGDHLNEKGAKLFSQYLESQVLNNQELSRHN